MFSRKELKWLVLLSGLALALRLFVILRYPHLLWLDSDDAAYIRSARWLLEHHIFRYAYPDVPTVFIPPLFPLFIAGVMKLFGTGDAGIQAVRIALAFVNTATVCLVIVLGKQLRQPAAGWIAASILAVFPSYLVMTGLILTETLFTFLLVLTLVALFHAIERKSYKVFAAAGFLLGLATLTRPTVALLPVLLGVYLWGRRDYRFRKALQAALVFGAAFVIALSPWILRNYIHFHKFIPLTVASGNPFLTGTYYDNNIWVDGHDPEFPDWPLHWKKVWGDEQATDNYLLELGKKRFAKEFEKDPVRYIEWYTVGKFKLFWWKEPLVWTEILQPIKEALIPIHRILMGLGLIGAIAALRKRIPFAPFLLLLLGYYTVMHMVFLATARYAYPMMYEAYLFTGIGILTLGSLLAIPFRSRSTTGTHSGSQ